jgi:peroxiredoxin
MQIYIKTLILQKHTSNIMKKNALFFMAVILTMAACTNKEPQFKINVNLANADGQTVYLQKSDQILDSAVISNWDAVFNTPVCNDNEMYSIMLKGWRRPIFFFTDHKDMCIEGDAQNPNAIVIKGSEPQARLDAFNKSYNELEAKLEADSTIDPADGEEILKMHCFDYVWDNPTDPVAHYVMYRYKWAFGPCELRTMIDNIHHADSTLTSSNLTLIEEYVEKLERVQPGQPFIDFTQNDPDGTPITLSKLAEGKLLLVDFWASWCPDCRKANPDVVAAYQKFHNQGFDVLGVSFDTNKESWLAAVEKDGLTWTQVSDLQGWSNAAGALYSIAFIPQNALIKDGMIVARNLEGEELFTEIESQLP